MVTRTASLIREKQTHRLPAVAPLCGVSKVNDMSTDHELFDDMVEAWERRRKVRPLAEAIMRAPDWKARLSAVRDYYAMVGPEIMRVPAWEWAFDPYEVDWPAIFTPIEFALWQDIRTLGIPLYPQFPMDAAGGKTFFADFASPARRVAIECDGVAYHGDARDRLRDDALARNGWKIFRFSGATCRGEEVSRDLQKIARSYMLPEQDLPEPQPGRTTVRGFDE